jgi:hypothetical protein
MPMNMVSSRSGKSCARHFEPPADINPAKPGDFNAGWRGPFLAGVAHYQQPDAMPYGGARSPLQHDVLGPPEGKAAYCDVQYRLGQCE